MDAYVYITLPFYAKQFDCKFDEQEDAGYDAPFYDADASAISGYGKAGVGGKPGFPASRMVYGDCGPDVLDECLRVRDQTRARRTKKRS